MRKSTFSCRLICSAMLQELEAMKRFTLVILKILASRQASSECIITCLILYTIVTSGPRSCCACGSNMDGVTVLDGFDELPSQQRAVILSLWR